MGKPDLYGEAFQKRFTASYGILSEKEPPLSELEVEILEKLAGIMRVDNAYAQTFLESMLSEDKPVSATFNYLLGDLYFENDKYFLSEAEYKNAIEKFPDFQRAWTNLGVLKLRAGDTDSALVALVRAVELGDQSPQTYGMLGYCHFEEGNLKSAEVAYDQAMLSQPDNLDWLEGKAQVYLKSGRFAEAAAMQDELIARRPDSVPYWLAQTNAFVESGDLKGAVRNLEIVRGMGHENFEILNLLGSVYLKLGMPGMAASSMLEALARAGSEQLAELAEGSKRLLAHGEIESARELFEGLQRRASELEGEGRADLLFARATLLREEGDLTGAIEALQEAEQLDPMDGQILLNLARLYDENGQRDKAYLVLRRAQDDPDSQYNALMLRAKLFIEDRRFDDAKAALSQAMRRRSSEAVQDLYARVEQAARDVAR